MCLPGNHLKLSELLFFSFSVRFSFICLFFIAVLTIYHMYHVAAFVNIKATQQKNSANQKSKNFKNSCVMARNSLRSSLRKLCVMARKSLRSSLRKLCVMARKSLRSSLRKLWQNKGFLWPVYARIRTESLESLFYKFRDLQTCNFIKKRL